MSDDCERCGQSKDTQKIKMQDGGRRVLCFGCFVHVKTEGRVHPSDPRISSAEVQVYNDD